MGFFIEICCVILAIFACKVERKWYNPATVTLIVWAVIMFLYELKMFGIYNVESSTYETISMGLVFFFIGCLLSTAEKRRIVFKKNRADVRIEENINYRLLKILGIIVFLFFAEEAVETLILARSGVSLFDIRTSLQGYADYSFSDNLYVLRSKIGPLYTWVILPVYNAMLILTCIDIFAGKKDKFLIALSVGCLLLKSLKEGSRVALFTFVIYLIFSLAIYGKKINLSAKAKKRIKSIVIIAVVIMVIISNIRISEGQKTLFEEIYLYFTCCVPLWDHWLSSFISSGTDFTYGATSLYGIIQFPATILTFLCGHTLDWYKAGQLSIQATEQFIQVRDAAYSYKSNAYTTMFYYFYKDAGMLGIAVGSLLFGFISTSVFKRLKVEMKVTIQSKRLVYVYLLLIQAMVLSFVRVYFSIASYSFTFLYVWIFIQKQYIKEE